MKYTSQCVIILFFLCFSSYVVAQPSPNRLDIYVDSSAIGAGTGEKAHPVRNLPAAQEIIAAQYRSEQDIAIHVRAGTYLQSEFRWTFFPDTLHSLTIESEGADRPIFDGQDRQATWAVFKAPVGRPTRVTIRGLKITHYWSAIVFVGDRSDPAKGNGGNVIEDNVFDEIGQKTQHQRASFAAIGLTRSSGNAIRRNRFSNFENIDNCWLRVVYMAHGSDRNVVEDNTFSGGCGALIKVRDASNDNVVKGNTFESAPDQGLLLDAYCDKRKMPQLCAVQECPSYGNRIEGSVGVGALRLSKSVWPDDAPGCPLAAGRKRITARP